MKGVSVASLWLGTRDAASPTPDVFATATIPAPAVPASFKKSLRLVFMLRPFISGRGEKGIGRERSWQGRKENGARS
jgi:hypothetical protein